MLRLLTANFDYIVVSIKESNNLYEMKGEELQASLEAREMRLKQRNLEREEVVEQEMQARFIKKFGKEKTKQRKNITNNEKSSKNSKNHSDSIKKVMGNKYSGKKIDMNEVHCYNCQGFGHYARDCRRKKESRVKDGDKVQDAHVEESDINDMLLLIEILSQIMNKPICGIYISGAATTSLVIKIDLPSWMN